MIMFSKLHWRISTAILKVSKGWFVIAFYSALSNPVFAADEYTIDGTFNGCSHGRLYGLVGGGILECKEYNYFYEYRPRVIASGMEVIVIGDEKISARLHNGSVLKTNISDEFEGCDFDKTYRLDNGLIFECRTYSFSYSDRPEVTIFVIKGRSPVVFIEDEEYDGTLYKTN